MEGGGFEPPKLTQLIYSQPPLSTWVPLQGLYLKRVLQPFKVYHSTALKYTLTRIKCQMPIE